ncbi:MAG: tRNA pseudouridine(55) synthase TruB [Bifidobacteriaceae bacterium]|jgi:tRNA pseudouridine55 synthase|nr:tRNA pseudouridine(55) synthase TruB [Bifidobacteriaceae bacterium]
MTIRPSPPRREPTPGLVVLDKPQGLTSHDCVARLRRLADAKKVGHAGTLDPLATGVLVLGVGRATRFLTFLVGLGKRYAATIRLGQSTTTDDADGAPTGGAVASALSPSRVETALRPLRGTLLQVPSAHSAVKVGGVRAYARARAGEDVVLPARQVEVSRFDLVRSRRLGDWLDLDVVVECSSGTYVRALARDLGTALGVGGHITALRRTALGPFDVSSATTLEALAEDFAVAPLGDAAAQLFPVLRLNAAAAESLAHGQRLPWSEPVPASPAGPRLRHRDTSDLVAALAEDGALVALVRPEGQGEAARFRAVAVFR